MNKGWSEKNKEVQALLSKEATFKEAIEKLIRFREEMFEQITQIVNSYPEEAFAQMPFAGAEGYHSKTLAYSGAAYFAERSYFAILIRAECIRRMAVSRLSPNMEARKPLPKLSATVPSGSPEIGRAHI